MYLFAAIDRLEISPEIIGTRSENHLIEVLRLLSSLLRKTGVESWVATLISHVRAAFNIAQGLVVIFLHEYLNQSVGLYKSSEFHRSKYHNNGCSSTRCFAWRSSETHIFGSWHVRSHHSLHVFGDFRGISHRRSECAEFFSEVRLGSHARPTITASNSVEIVVQYARSGDVRCDPELIQEFVVAAYAEVRVLRSNIGRCQNWTCDRKSRMHSKNRCFPCSIRLIMSRGRPRHDFFSI